jgi:drug/metabolite transporter superfamily protein YnfA
MPNFTILAAFLLVSQSFTVDLQLKPVTSPQREESFGMFLFSVGILPLTLAFEELGFRFMPHFFLEPLSRMKLPEIRRWRIWLHDHFALVFILSSMSWAALVHQLNVTSADLTGRLIYFGVQSYSGFYLAWLFHRKGFYVTWFIHLVWDLVIIGLNLLLPI